MTETPLKPVELKACPWCQKPMAITGGCNPIGRCDTENCWMHERKMAVAVDSPFMVEQWNTRTVDTELLEALNAASALASACMAAGCYSHEEITEIARAIHPTFIAAITKATGHG